MTGISVQSVQISPRSGDLTAGDTLAVTIATNAPVRVTGGTPTLATNDRSIATYDPATSSPTRLIFDLTIANGDDTPDLQVTGLSLNGAIIAGDGTMSFNAPTQFLTGHDHLLSVDFADLNGDAKSDLIVTDLYDNRLSVYLNQGDDRFSNSIEFMSRTSLGISAIKDLNGDGRLDIIVANDDNSGNASVLLGTGNGNFVLGQTFQAGIHDADIYTADLNNDGFLDILETYPELGSISIRLNNGHGFFNPAFSDNSLQFSYGSYPSILATTDFNGDGNVDLVVNASSQTKILYGDGTGHFSQGVTFSHDSLFRAWVVDLNGDGHKDLVAEASGKIYTQINDGSGHFSPENILSYDLLAYISAVADLNGDSYPDIVTNDSLNSDFDILRNDRQGSFSSVGMYPTSNGSSFQDLNGDGLPEMVNFDYQTGVITISDNSSIKPGDLDAANIFFDTAYVVDTTPPNVPPDTSLVTPIATVGTPTTDDPAVPAAPDAGPPNAPAAPLFVTTAPSGAALDLSSAALGRLLDSGTTLQFMAGVESVRLSDGVLSVGPNTSEALLQRLYLGLFGRTADQAGLGIWDAQLAAGQSASDVAAHILATPEAAAIGGMADPQFVTTLYQNLLGHAPAAGDLAYWTGALSYGRAAVAVVIANSAEAADRAAADTAHIWIPNQAGAQTERLFQTALARSAGVADGEAQSWADMLQRGAARPHRNWRLPS